MNLDGYLICQDMLESLLLEEEKFIYLFLNPILNMLMNDNYPICDELANNSDFFFTL